MARPASAGFEVFEHTADVGLRVWGWDMCQLFSAQGEEPEDMLVAWLEEILFAFEVERFAPSSVEIENFESGRIAGRLLGEDFDEERHLVHHLIKAVTYHNLAIERTDGGWQVRIIFDV